MLSFVCSANHLHRVQHCALLQGSPEITHKNSHIQPTAIENRCFCSNLRGSTLPRGSSVSRRIGSCPVSALYVQPDYSPRMEASEYSIPYLRPSSIPSTRPCSEHHE